MPSSQMSEASTEIFFFFPFESNLIKRIPYCLLQEGTCQQPVPHALSGGNSDTRLWASSRPATGSSLSMSRRNICKLPSHVGFFRKPALIQPSVGKGGRWQLHTFTRYLQFRKQQGSEQAESSVGVISLVHQQPPPPRSATNVHCVLMKRKAVGKVKEEGHTDTFPAIYVSLFRPCM